VGLASEIFVFTASNPDARRHRERTIEQPVRLEEIEPHAAALARQLRAEGHEQIRCWGSVPGPNNRKSWRRMQPGHWALLYAGEERFPWLLRVARTAQLKQLARSLWGEDGEGRTWELMFFFDLALRVDLGLGEVREALGYEGDDWVPQGLQYPAAARQDALLGSFGTLEAFASSVVEEGAEDGAILPSPEELMVGGEFGGPPDRPPRSPQPRQPPDPDRSGRGAVAHEETVDKLCKHVGPTFRKGRAGGINHDGTWKVDGAYCMAEVKSINNHNQVEQLQKGLGQILHNLFKAEENEVEIFEAYLIAEREPRNSSLWRRLAEKHGIVFSWPERFAEDITKPR
jgi:hypothetical protein